MIMKKERKREREKVMKATKTWHDKNRGGKVPGIRNSLSDYDISQSKAPGLLITDKRGVMDRDTENSERVSKYCNVVYMNKQ